MQIQCHTNIYSQSFFPQTISLWNTICRCLPTVIWQLQCSSERHPARLVSPVMFLSYCKHCFYLVPVYLVSYCTFSRQATVLCSQCDIVQYWLNLYFSWKKNNGTICAYNKRKCLKLHSEPVDFVNSPVAIAISQLLK